ncbi:MAG: DsbA family oxidoreductase [Thermoanaerobaculia bacterium]
MAERTSLVRLLKDFDLDLDWRGFELHPETPPGGTRLDVFFPPERVKQMAEYMKTFAARFGIDEFRQPERIPNTRRALALAEVARDESRLDLYRNRAMDAHWKDGMSLEDDNDLRRIAHEVGLSDGAVERSKSDPQYLARVDAIREEASGMGVRGIPTFVIGKHALSGAQPYEVFVDFATKARAQQRIGLRTDNR